MPLFRFEQGSRRDPFLLSKSLSQHRLCIIFQHNFFSNPCRPYLKFLKLKRAPLWETCFKQNRGTRDEAPPPLCLASNPPSVISHRPFLFLSLFLSLPCLFSSLLLPLLCQFLDSTARHPNPLLVQLDTSQSEWFGMVLP